MTFDDILAVYAGSDAEATKALYARLLTFAPRGVVAVNLLRTCKASERAKKYRGKPGRGQPTYRQMAYDKKDWSIGELCRALRDAPDVVPSWGWGRDPKAIGFENVLYVDIPGAGQVSFHTEHRRDGADYGGVWNGVRLQAPNRICKWAEAILAGREVTNEGEQDGIPTRAEGTRSEGDAGGQGGQERQEAFDL
jgi:hypothetical protein